MKIEGLRAGGKGLWEGGRERGVQGSVTPQDGFWGGFFRLRFAPCLGSLGITQAEQLLTAHHSEDVSAGFIIGVVISMMIVIYLKFSFGFQIYFFFCILFLERRDLFSARSLASKGINDYKSSVFIPLLAAVRSRGTKGKRKSLCLPFFKRWRMRATRPDSSRDVNM